MENKRIDLPMCGICTFGKYPFCSDLSQLSSDIDVAILGAPFDMGTDFRPGARFAPRAIRQASMLDAHSPSKGIYYAERDCYYLKDAKIVDCGDSDMLMSDSEYCIKRIEEDVRAIAAKGIMPLVIGGDHTTTTPVVRGLNEVGDFTIIHIDAHLDWTDGPAHIKISQGSPMRRAAECPYVLPMVHIGIRWVGSSGPQDFADARAHGDQIIFAREVRQDGVQAVLNRIPKSEQYYITLDVDGFDPSIIPATGTPSAGGLTYYEVVDILAGVAKMGKVIGMDVVELAPNYDASDASSLQIAQVIYETLANILYEQQLREEKQ